MSFLDSAFEFVTNAAPTDYTQYNRIVNAITDLTAILAGLSDQAGNVTLAAAKDIEWDGTPYLTWSAAKVQVDTLEITTAWTFGTLAPTGEATVSSELTIGSGGTMTLSGNLVITGKITSFTVADSGITIAQIAEPDDPADNGQSVLWLSNGSGAGDVGDIMLKLKYDDMVKTTTLVDFV